MRIVEWVFRMKHYFWKCQQCPPKIYNCIHRMVYLNHENRLSICDTHTIRKNNILCEKPIALGRISQYVPFECILDFLKWFFSPFLSKKQSNIIYKPFFEFCFKMRVKMTHSKEYITEWQLEGMKVHQKFKKNIESQHARGFSIEFNYNFNFHGFFRILWNLSNGKMFGAHFWRDWLFQLVSVSFLFS